MKNPESPNIILFSIDLVLNHILSRILGKCKPNFTLTVFEAFSDANTITNHDSIDLILVDDAIIGTSSYELISYIRLDRKINCPIVYFGVNEHGSEKKAISIGANHFVNKPFNPNETVELFNQLLSM